MLVRLILKVTKKSYWRSLLLSVDTALSLSIAFLRSALGYL